MPRIRDVDGEDFDYCLRCYPDRSEARLRHGSVGPGSNRRGNSYEYNASHPCYDGTDLRCDGCNRLLSSSDD